MSNLGHHSLEFLAWDTTPTCSTRVDPAVENREEVGLFCLFQPNRFLNSVKIKTEDGFLRGVFLERCGHGGYLIKVVVMALAEEVTREPSPILSWSNNNYEI